MKENFLTSQEREDAVKEKALEFLRTINSGITLNDKEGETSYALTK